jgi:hypothetical protein
VNISINCSQYSPLSCFHFPAFSEYPSLEGLSSLVDLKHCCGYVTLLSLDKEPVAAAAAKKVSTGGAKNGKVHNAHLLEEELDSIADHPMAGKKQDSREEEDSSATGANGNGSNRGEKLKSMKLDLEPSAGKPEPDNGVDRWILFDLNFGIPLFDSDLNRQICEGIVRHGLWKTER